jgi:hypothetical protein
MGDTSNWVTTTAAWATHCGLTREVSKPAVFVGSVAAISSGAGDGCTDSATLTPFLQGLAGEA